MVNCNPETVSTDYDTSDRLYFEPLTLEDVLEVVHAERAAGPVAGVIVQLGGQTPLGLAQALKDAGVPIARHPAGGDPPGRGARGVRPRARAGRAARAAVRARLARTSRRSPSPATSATRCWCGPRTSWAGAAWRSSTTTRCSRATSSGADPDQPGAPGARRPVPRRRGRDRRRRAVRRRRSCTSAGVMEHIEEAGIHSGDSACALPPITLGRGRGRADPAQHRGDRARRRRARPAQRAVRPGRRRPLRAGGEPARVAARCRSCPRRPRCRWPRRRPG